MDLFVGVDIASRSFVAFNDILGVHEVENSKKPILSFLKQLPKDSMLAIESTGGYGALLAELALAAGFTVYIVQPAKVKKYREAGPTKGKTDRIDAVAIHDYLRSYHEKLHVFKPLPSFEARLRSLTRRRQGLVDKVASIRLQLRSLGDSRGAIAAVLRPLERRIEMLHVAMSKMLEQVPDAQSVLSVPGVGPVTAAVVLPVLRTVPFRSKYALDSFAGMDLLVNESGRFKGRRRISKQGDRRIRRALYVAAMAATRCKVWRGYYEALLKEKRLTKIQAICALARKLLHTIYGVYKSQTKFARARLKPKAQTAR